MPGFDGHWRRRRVIGFLVLGLTLYAGLFIASDRLLVTKSARNPFYRIATTPAHVDWIVLGASHALPLSMGDAPELLADRTGLTVRTLALAGGGPVTMRLVADRFFADHDATGVLIVIDRFAFLDTRWNAGRMADADVLPKIPADWRTLGAFRRALGRDLSLTTALGYATGSARINDHDRFTPDRWEAETRFDSVARPSDAADRARLDYLFPRSPDDVPDDIVARALDALRDTVALAQVQGASVVLVEPPLPARFAAQMPDTPALDAALTEITAEMEVLHIDFTDALPDPAFYFDTDHLNRAGVVGWLEAGLQDVLVGTDGNGD